MGPARHRRRRHEPSDAASSARPPGADYAELVLAVHAVNMVQAELYRAELAAHGIPAVVEGESAAVGGIPDIGAGVPVLVPENLADEAAELIAELESTRPEGMAVDDVFDEELDDTEELPETDLDELDLDDEEDDDLEDDWDDDDWDDDEDDWDDDDWDDEEDDQ